MSAFFTAEEIADFQAEGVAAFDLVDLVTVMRIPTSGGGAVVPDGAGGYKPAGSSPSGWETVTTFYGLLAVSRLTPREREIASQIGAPVGYDVYVKSVDRPDVRTQDRLVIDGRTFEVKGIGKAAKWATLDRIFCVELQK